MRIVQELNTTRTSLFRIGKGGEDDRVSQMLFSLRSRLLDSSSKHCRYRSQHLGWNFVYTIHPQNMKMGQFSCVIMGRGGQPSLLPVWRGKLPALEKENADSSPLIVDHMVCRTVFLLTNSTSNDFSQAEQLRCRLSRSQKIFPLMFS